MTKIKKKNLTSYINNLETMIFFNKNFVINPKNYNKILKNFFYNIYKVTQCVNLVQKVSKKHWLNTA